jgi:hypothetical protein
MMAYRADLIDDRGNEIASRANRRTRRRIAVEAKDFFSEGRERVLLGGLTLT